MSKKRQTSDPRQLRGSIVGPGGPHDRAGVLFEVDRAVLLRSMHVAVVDDEGMLAMLLSGRVNKTTDQADVLFLMDDDGLAAILTELLALLSRAGDGRGAAIRALVEARFAELDREGSWGPGGGA